jgi:hypothetical protein
MGRWAQRKRTGGVSHYGSLTPPSAAEWHTAGGGSGIILATRDIAIPVSANCWEIRIREVGTTTWIHYNVSADPTIYADGLTPGHTYELQASWWFYPTRLSEYSASKTQVAGS